MVSWHGLIFKSTSRFWKNVRIFAFFNRTMFEIAFVALYSLEQAFLVWYTYRSKDIVELGFVISMFAIIVLTTFALQKLVMESRIKHLESDVQNLIMEKRALESKTRYIIEKYEEAIMGVSHQTSKNLNTQEHSPDKKREKV